MTENLELQSASAEPLTTTSDASPTGDRAEAEPAFANHVESRTVVLPDHRVLFLPVPKAGWTSILWMLSELAGIPTEKFDQSDLPSPSTTLTVHDMSLWDSRYRLSSYESEERERILTERGWFRFSVVRDPSSRLWSAWQSKLLLREPRFASTFGDEPWFPRVPERPAELVEDFRRFAAMLASETPQDVHWAVQQDLTRQLPLDHVGHVERLAETLALLRDHVGESAWRGVASRRNQSPLPMPPGAYDDAATAALAERYGADFRAFGYDLPQGDGVPGETERWEERVELLLPLFQEIIERHTRVAHMHSLAQRRIRRIRTLESRLETTAARAVGQARSPVLTNLEEETEFNVRWAWADGKLPPGFTAVVRVKNEARALPWVLPPLFRAVSHVIVVDNGSTDGTMAVARGVAENVGATDRFELLTYPFSVARCGSEHLETPADSVHSLAYFYNWSFSHVRTEYALKWDGDMVLADVAVNALRDLAWQLEAAEVIVKMPRYPLYVADDKRAFLDIGLSNREAWAWPNRPGYSFVKALEWELPLWGSDAGTTMLPDFGCVELKHLDADEFSHWSDSDFDASERTQRKRREWRVFHALQEGVDPPDGVIPVEAPPGQHVIEYVRSTWLPEKSGELTGIGERIIGRLARLGA